VEDRSTGSSDSYGGKISASHQVTGYAEMMEKYRVMCHSIANWRLSSVSGRAISQDYGINDSD
jgi:hypothetical protein